MWGKKMSHLNIGNHLKSCGSQISHDKKGCLEDLDVWIFRMLLENKIIIRPGGGVVHHNHLHTHSPSQEGRAPLQLAKSRTSSRRALPPFLLRARPTSPRKSRLALVGWTTASATTVDMSDCTTVNFKGKGTVSRGEMPDFKEHKTKMLRYLSLPDYLRFPSKGWDSIGGWCPYCWK